MKRSCRECKHFKVDCTPPPPLSDGDGYCSPGGTESVYFEWRDKRLAALESLWESLSEWIMEWIVKGPDEYAEATDRHINKLMSRLLNAVAKELGYDTD